MNDGHAHRAVIVTGDGITAGATVRPPARLPARRGQSWCGTRGARRLVGV